MDITEEIPAEEIKDKLRNLEGKDILTKLYCGYLADRFPDKLSPYSFHVEADKIVREMITGQTTDPTKPIPPFLRDQARTLGSYLIDEIVGTAKAYCSEEFAAGVLKAHNLQYG
ncbi:MAG: hypothetical protein Q7S74_06500 [Nanoarchaeota archaeon]|nr:hypothetical protein [Nanoarchaeota archaeon]